MGGVHINLLSCWKKCVHLSEVVFMGNMGWPVFFNGIMKIMKNLEMQR